MAYWEGSEEQWELIRIIQKSKALIVGRKSESIPDGKSIRHYVNGVDDTDGMHPGIRKECPDQICIAIRTMQQLYKEQIEKGEEPHIWWIDK